MKGEYTAEVSIQINAPGEKVWQTITSPEKIKQFLMGTDVHTDWKEGSPITYTGSYQGKQYLDKGEIRKIIPGKLIQSTYLSSMQGKEDLPENYNLVTYELSDVHGGTLLKLTQDNVRSEQEKSHSEGNWKMVFEKIKEIAEKS